MLRAGGPEITRAQRSLLIRSLRWASRLFVAGVLLSSVVLPIVAAIGRVPWHIDVGVVGAVDPNDIVPLTAQRQKRLEEELRKLPDRRWVRAKEGALDALAVGGPLGVGFAAAWAVAAFSARWLESSSKQN